MSLPEELVADQPSWIREDPDNYAVQRCFAYEAERIRERAEEVSANFRPSVATALGLPWWEAYLGAPDPTGKTVEERRAEVLARINATVPDSRGSTWEEQVTALIGAGWTYEEDSAAFELTLTVPGDPPFDWLETLLRPFTPAHLDLVITGEAGFLLDQSQMDEEPFHAS